MIAERAALIAAELEELDLDAMSQFAERRARTLFTTYGRDVAATRLGLVAKSGQRLSPTAVGLLMFGLTPQLLHPEWGVSAVAINGLGIADPLVGREDLEGSLPVMLEAALAFAECHAQFVDPQFGDSASQYPLSAVREALINAMIHRDLRRTGRVAIRMFSDRMEIWSPGGPVEHAGDLEELSEEGGVSAPRNPLLAATARAMGLGEQIGRGLPTMRRAFAGAASGALELRTSPREVLVALPSRLRAPAHAQSLS